MGKMMIILLFVTFSSVYGHVIIKPECGAHAHYADCPASHQKSCANRLNPIPKCGDNCGPGGCECDIGFVWDVDCHDCIREEECCEEDICCLPGFFYKSCGSFRYCKGCSGPGLGDRNRGRPGCYCPDNQFLKGDKCVYKRDC